MVNRPIDHLTIEKSVSITDIESLTHGYILNCRCEAKSPATIAIYDIVLRNFIWFNRQYGHPLEVRRINANHIREFLWYLSSETDRWGGNTTATKRLASRTTVHNYHRTLRTFFQWLEREKLIVDNPFANLKTPKPDKKVVQALTTTEIERLLRACSDKTVLDIRNKAIVSILLDCGLRVAEMAALTMDDLCMDTGTMLVQKGKGGKQRTVHMGAEAQKALWRYVSIYRRTSSGRLFVSRGGVPLDVSGVKTLIKRLGKLAKVKVHPHKLRHTFAISFLRAGGDAFSLQYLLGHSTLQMTQRYLQSLNAEDAIKAHMKFSPLDNMGQ